MSNDLSITRNGEIVIVRFARPEIRNPLSKGVLTELEKAVCECERDATLRGMVFTGTGDVFASGADLNEIAAISAGSAAEFARRGQCLMNAIAALSVTTVAAVNGYCFGGALDLALACERRIASPDAKFAHPGTGRGIITGWGGTQRLPRLVGSANALEMFFTASPIDAARALRIGLVDDIDADPLSKACQFVTTRDVG